MQAPVGPRSVVATSPDKIAECKWELEADTEKFMEAIEVKRNRKSSERGMILPHRVLDADLALENCLSLRLGGV